MNANQLTIAHLGNRARQSPTALEWCHLCADPVSPLRLGYIVAHAKNAFLVLQAADDHLFDLTE